MKRKKPVLIKSVIAAFAVCVCVLILQNCGSQALEVFAKVAVQSAKLYLPHSAEADKSEEKSGETKKAQSSKAQKNTANASTAPRAKKPPPSPIRRRTFLH